PKRDQAQPGGRSGEMSAAAWLCVTGGSEHVAVNRACVLLERGFDEEVPPFLLSRVQAVLGLLVVSLIHSRRTLLVFGDDCLNFLAKCPRCRGGCGFEFARQRLDGEEQKVEMPLFVFEQIGRLVGAPLHLGVRAVESDGDSEVADLEASLRFLYVDVLWH